MKQGLSTSTTTHHHPGADIQVGAGHTVDGLVWDGSRVNSSEEENETESCDGVWWSPFCERSSQAQTKLDVCCCFSLFRSAQRNRQTKENAIDPLSANTHTHTFIHTNTLWKRQTRHCKGTRRQWKQNIYHPVNHRAAHCTVSGTVCVRVCVCVKHSFFLIL